MTKVSISYLHFYKMSQEDVKDYLTEEGIDATRDFSCIMLDNGGLIEYMQDKECEDE